MTKNNIPKGIDIIAAALLVVGGLNWGFVGIFGINLVEFLFGTMSPASRIVYTLVGVAALYQLFMWRAIQRRWGCDLWPASPKETTA